MSKGYFIEKSRYPVWLVLSILIIIIVLFIIGINKTDIKVNELWISLGIFMAVWLLFLAIQINLRVDNDGIQFRFLPFINRQKHIRWSELSVAQVRSSRPLFEFGGWGFRIKHKTRAYTLYGKWGLDITYKDGKRLFIGVKDFKELIRVMEDSVYPNYPELNKKIE